MSHDQTDTSRERPGMRSPAERFAAALVRIEAAAAALSAGSPPADVEDLTAEVERLRRELAQVSEERDKFAAALYRLREENESLRARNGGAVTQIDQVIARVERILSTGAGMPGQ